VLGAQTFHVFSVSKSSLLGVFSSFRGPQRYRSNSESPQSRLVGVVVSRQAIAVVPCGSAAAYR